MDVRQMNQSLERWELGVKDVQRRMILAPTPRERWRALWLLAQGWTVAATAEMPDRDLHTIGRWAASKCAASAKTPSVQGYSIAVYPAVPTRWDRKR